MYIYVLYGLCLQLIIRPQSTKQVLSKKKQEYLKKKSMLIDNEVPTVSEETVTEKSTEVEEVPYGNSFGQSAGLKDDLDVEDDGIGNALGLLSTCIMCF